MRTHQSAPDSFTQGSGEPQRGVLPSISGVGLDGHEERAPLGFVMLGIHSKEIMRRWRVYCDRDELTAFETLCLTRLDPRIREHAKQDGGAASE